MEDASPPCFGRSLPPLWRRQLFRTSRVLSRRETIELVGVSEKTWERLEAAGDVPMNFSCHKDALDIASIDIKQWLDARGLEAAS